MIEDRKEKILLKALELYMIEGYANVSITDLQSALNMGRGTLYYYFKDKDELFQEVVDEFLIKPKQRALERVKDTADIPEMIARDAEPGQDQGRQGFLHRLQRQGLASDSLH